MFTKPLSRPRALLVMLLVGALLAFALPVLAGSPFWRTVSLTGAAPQRLSTVLTTGGYAGDMQLHELTICNPPSSANSIYRGMSDVDATNGVEYQPGDCYTERAVTAQTPIDATQTYLFVSSTQNISVALRSR